MRFSQISEEDANAQASGLWPNGTYDYEIKDAEELQSKAGNDMIKLELWIFNDSGNRTMVFDYLVSQESFLWKIRHFATSCGLLDQYNKGNLIASEIIGRTGRCVIGTQPPKGQYEAKNIVKGYVKLEGGRTASRSPASRTVAPGSLDDEIPF